MTLPFAPVLAQPSLNDLLALLQKQIMLNLNCHAIGTVQSFNSLLQTAQITINYPQTYFQISQVNGSYVQNDVPYPILLDVPVIVLGGGPAYLTFPIATGDQCFLLFNDRDIENWWVSGTVSTVNTVRLHSISDAVAIVGLRSLNKALSGYSMTHAVFGNGTTQVGVGPDSVLITNGTTLGDLLGQLTTQLTNLTTALITLTTAMSTATPTSVVAQIATPSSVAFPLITNVQTAINAIATSLGELLE
jgi:hypothetical protein